MRLRKITIIGLICLFVGVAVLFTGFAMSGFDITKISPEAQYQTKSFVSQDTVNEIIVEEKNQPVEIRQSGDDKIHIIYHENENNFYDIKLSDDRVLSIIKKDTRKWYDHIFNFNFRINKLEIAIPADFSGNLTVDDSNSGINISEVNTRDIALTTSNGKITADNVTASGNFMAATSNAMIDLSKIKSAGILDCHTSSAKITFADVEGNDIDIKTSNGIVDIDSIISKNDIKIETSNGQIRFKNIDFEDTLECHSSNASIKGEIKGSMTDYSIRSKTSNGKSNLPENAGGGAKTVDIETSNGSIEVDFSGQ